jgi:hypothetical protein
MSETATDEQLRLWVEGTSVHNDEAGECCPDFSCCQPGLLAPKETREAFARASEEERTSMLMMFLGAAIELAMEGKEKGVYIAGDPTNYTEPS